jgi:hypothetical protein
MTHACSDTCRDTISARMKEANTLDPFRYRLAYALPHIVHAWSIGEPEDRADIADALAVLLRNTSLAERAVFSLILDHAATENGARPGGILFAILFAIADAEELRSAKG